MGSNLDYDKIKHDITSHQERTQALLLQALRWVSQEFKFRKNATLFIAVAICLFRVGII